METKIGEGKDVAIAAGDGGIHAVWIRGTQLIAWQGGKTSVLAEKAAFPALATLPDRSVLAAWEENGAITVRKLNDR